MEAEKSPMKIVKLVVAAGRGVGYVMLNNLNGRVHSSESCLRWVLLHVAIFHDEISCSHAENSSRVDEISR